MAEQKSETPTVFDRIRQTEDAASGSVWDDDFISKAAEQLAAIIGICQVEPKLRWSKELQDVAWSVLFNANTTATFAKLDFVEVASAIIDLFDDPNIPARIAVSFRNTSFPQKIALATRYNITPAQLTEDTNAMCLPFHLRPPDHWGYHAK